MDEEDAIVQELVKSLAFEIEASTEDNIIKWSTTNSTPLNVKVRVRSPNEPRLVRKGPIPLPRICITTPERLRLVSSDQTIISFNIYLDKQIEYKRRKLFRLFNIGGCLGTNSDDDGPYLPSTSNQKAIAHNSNSQSESAITHTIDKVLPQTETKKWPFGRCKPGGCLDPPFAKERYAYTPSNMDRSTKVALQIKEHEKYQVTGMHVDSIITEKPSKDTNSLKIRSNENCQDKLDTESRELESKKEIEGMNIESHSKSKEGFISSARITIKDEVDSKKLTNIYARNSRENAIITYHTDTSSSESLYGPIPKERESIKSYNESQRQTYEYPESYFVPPKDVVRYKEEERRYSKEPSNHQIGAGNSPEDHNIIDKINSSKQGIDHKLVSQNARTSKENNKDKLKLTLTELQSNNYYVPHKIFESQISSTFIASDSKEPVSHILTNLEDHEIIKTVFKTTTKSNMNNDQEVENSNLQEPKDSRSGMIDIRKKESKANKPNIALIEKPDEFTLKSGEISISLKSQASIQRDSDIDIFSEVIETNWQILDDTPILYSKKECSNAEIGYNGKVNENDIADKTNLTEIGTTDYKSIFKNAEVVKNINTHNIEPKVDKTEPNNINQNVTTDKISPLRLVCDSKEPVPDFFSKNINDRGNAPDKSLRSENIDATNIQSSADRPTNKKLDYIDTDESKKPINLEESPVNDSILNVFCEDVKNNNQVQDIKWNSYSSSAKDKMGMQNNMFPSPDITLLYSNEDNCRQKPSLSESESNATKEVVSSHQDIVNVFSKTDQILPKTDLQENKKTDIVPIVIIDTHRFSNQSRASPSKKESKSQEIINDVDLKLPTENKILDLKNSTMFSCIPPPKSEEGSFPQTPSKQNIESTNQVELDEISCNQSNPCHKGVEETIKNNYGEINRTSLKESKITNKEPVIKLERKDYATLNDLYSEVQQQETSVRSEKNRNAKNLSPCRKLSYENKEFDVSSTHSIDSTPKHSSRNDISDEVDILPKKQTSAILQKTLFISRQDSDIHDDGVNTKTSTQLKRHTFTIIRSDTSLPKQDDIEESPNDVTNIYSEAISNTIPVSSSDTLDKADILDIKSTVDRAIKATVQGVNKNESKIIDLHKTISKEQANNVRETLSKSNNELKNDLIPSDNQTEALYKLSENDNDMPVMITSDNSPMTDGYGSLGGQIYDKLDTKKSEYKVSSGNLLDYHIPEYLQNAGYDRIWPSTQVNGKVETLNKGTKDFDEDSAIYSTLSQKRVQEIIQPEADSTGSKSLKKADKQLKNSESNTFSLLSENPDKTENYTKTQEEVLFRDFTTDAHWLMSEKIENKKFEFAVDENLVPVITEKYETKLSLTRDGLLDIEEKKLFAPSTDGNQLFQNRNTSETENITNKLLVKGSYSSNAQDTYNLSTPLSQNNSNSKHFDRFEYVAVIPGSDEQLIESYKEIEDLMKLDDAKHKYVNMHSELGKSSLQKVVPEELPSIAQVTNGNKSISSNQTVTQTQFTYLTETKNNNKKITVSREKLYPSGNIYSELSTNALPEVAPNIALSISEVTDYDQFIAPDQTETQTHVVADTNSIQQVIEIPREKVDESDILHYYDSIITPNETEFTKKMTDQNSGFINKPKSVSEKSSHHAGYSDLISEVLSNISEKSEIEGKNPKQTTERTDALGRNSELIQINTEANLDNAQLDDYSHTNKEYVPTLPTIIRNNIDYTPKLEGDDYNKPIDDLEDISMSKLEFVQDAMNKPTETIDTIKQQSKYYETIVQKPFNKRKSIENRTDQLSSNLTNSQNDNTYLDRNTFVMKPYIIDVKQKETTLPSHQVTNKSEGLNQNDISYLDMSFFSYINNDNQRVVQTYSPPIEQHHHKDATVTIVKTLIRHGNEIKIPVDKEKDLTLNIVDKHIRISNGENNIGSQTKYSHPEQEIVDRAKKQDVLTKNLALIYESGLIPLHNIIKDLTQQVNTLTERQEILKELTRSARKTKSMRVIPVIKRCGCKRI